MVEGYPPPNWSRLDSDRARGIMAFKLSLAGNYVGNLQLLRAEFETVEGLLDRRLRELGAR